MDRRSQATGVALRALRACYKESGIVAGNHHFTDYWARDGFFAALGSLAIGDQEIVEKQVDMFFAHQKLSGLVPYRIMRGPISVQKYLGHPTYYKTPKPTYRLRSIGPHVLDGTTLTTLFAAKCKMSKYIPNIKKALFYLVTREQKGLLFDGPMSEWNDCTWKWGNLLYSNIIYWYMYKELAAWQKRHDPAWAKELEEKEQEIASALRKRLWNGKFFADWYDYKRRDYLYPFGNCLAIIWGLTTPAESASILEAVGKARINFSVDTNTPAYPWWRTDALEHLLGINDYQNHGTLWWQTATAYLKALRHTKHHQEAKQYESTLMEKIIADQEIYEVYERDGRPLKRFQYTAESPFAWASGMILWAFAV